MEWWTSTLYWLNQPSGHSWTEVFTLVFFMFQFANVWCKEQERKRGAIDEYVE